MPESSPVVPAREIGQRLKAAGLLPQNCRRFVIDSGEPDGVVKIYWECFADPATMDVVLDAMLSFKPPAISQTEIAEVEGTARRAKVHAVLAKLALAVSAVGDLDLSHVIETALLAIERLKPD